MTKVSIIICTHNRAYAINDCLDAVAVAAAQAPLAEVEIVLVNNASTDQTAETVKNWAVSHAVSVQLVDEPRKGLSAARNCGLRHATGDLFVFTDDDCRLSPTYLQELLRYDANDREKLVMRGGRVELGDPTDLPLTIKLVDVPMEWSLKANSARHENLGNTLLGCNMAMRRQVAEQLGAFDELLGAGSSIPGGEDTDYIFRAYLGGIVIQSVPDMIVRHFHGRKTVSDGNSLFRNYSLGGGALYMKYLFSNPVMCLQFYWDVKNVWREVVTRRNLFMPSMDFSLVDKVYYCIIGAYRYAGVRIKKSWGHNEG